MKTETANTKLSKRGVGRLAGAFGLLLVLSLVASLALPALAAPVMPHQFYGNVTIGGAPAPEGTVVSARIDGVEYVATTVDAVGRYGYDPLLKVPGDDPATPAKEGGVPGEIVEFYVAGILAEQYEFEIWGITELDLAVAPTTVELTVVADPAEGGTVTGSGMYDPGTDAPITATAADECWHFVEWTGDGIADPTSASTTVLMDANKTVTAHFVKYSYTLVTVAEPPEGGTVTGGGIYDCCTYVQVEAIPIDDCWYFTGWSGDLDGSENPTTIHIDGDKTVIANFAKYSYTLTVGAEPPEGGSVTGGGVYECCTYVQVEAIPADECWYFTGWSGDLDGTENPTTIHIDGDKTVIANFARYSYTLTVGAEPAEGGTVTGGGVYDCCTTVPVEAIPADGSWYFTGWSGDLDGSDNPTTIHIDGDKTVIANFTMCTHTITASAGLGGSIDPEGVQVVACGATVTFTITADAGFVIQGVLVDGVPIGAVSTYTFEDVDADHTIHATFGAPGEFTALLDEGWNLLSTPVKLAADSNTLADIFTPASVADIEVFMRWDAQNVQWVLVYGDFELTPLEAIYVKVKAGATVTAMFIPSEEVSIPPSRALHEGLNLIGPAPAYAAGGFPAMSLVEALVSIEEAAGGLRGYIIVISPGLNQPSWVYTLGGTTQDLLPYKGYWVIMENADTLWGFSTTPIVP